MIWWRRSDVQSMYKTIELNVFKVLLFHSIYVCRWWFCVFFSIVSALFALENPKTINEITKSNKHKTYSKLGSQRFDEMFALVCFVPYTYTSQNPRRVVIAQWQVYHCYKLFVCGLLAKFVHLRVVGCLLLFSFV